MKYLEKSFTAGKANTDEYRDGWERTFGKTDEDPPCPGCNRTMEDINEEYDQEDFCPLTCPGCGACSEWRY